jgi:hypothetical protein
MSAVCDTRMVPVFRNLGVKPDSCGEMMIAHTLRFLATITTTDQLLQAWTESS